MGWRKAEHFCCCLNVAAIGVQINLLEIRWILV
jgi:hypothetical protein